jgi:hypothetical protein
MFIFKYKQSLTIFNLRHKIVHFRYRLGVTIIIALLLGNYPLMLGCNIHRTNFKLCLILPIMRLKDIKNECYCRL